MEHVFVSLVILALNVVNVVQDILEQIVNYVKKNSTNQMARVKNVSAMVSTLMVLVIQMENVIVCSILMERIVINVSKDTMERGVHIVMKGIT